MGLWTISTIAIAASLLAMDVYVVGGKKEGHGGHRSGHHGGHHGGHHDSHQDSHHSDGHVAGKPNGGGGEQQEHETKYNYTIKEYNMDERIIASRFQLSKPLKGWRCFEDGLRLACDCSKPYPPCCVDKESGECYMPTSSEWSDWISCSLWNYECGPLEECRIAFDEMTKWMYPHDKNDTSNSTDDDHYPHHPWRPKKPGCYVQRAQCRSRQYGVWSNWTDGNCSSDCLQGELVRTRVCLDGEGNVISLEYCEGGEESSVEVVPCNTDLCMKASDWEKDGRCYVDIEGNCLQDFIRYCKKGPNLTEDCSMMTDFCEHNCSRLNVSGYIYGNWSECESNCSTGVQSRTGQCVYLIDHYPSTDCDPDLEIQYRECDLQNCRNYSDWIPGGCTEDCNGGIRNETRICLDNGTIPFEYCVFRTDIPCNTLRCVYTVNVAIATGNLSDAGTTGDVTVILYGSIRNHTHVRVGGFLRNSVVQLTFNMEEIGDLLYIELGHDDTGDDPSWFVESVNITFNDNSYYFPCGTWFDSALGDGKTSRILVPGEQCHQENFIYVFGEWSNCSDPCSPGTQERIGSCIDNATGDASDNCVNGSSVLETRVCNEDYCNNYTDWSAFSGCSVTCGSGSRIQTRECRNSSKTTTQECTVNSTECMEPVCVGPGNWTEFGECNNTCSPGIKVRTRPCVELETGAPATNCTEDLIDYMECNTDLCTEYSSFVANTSVCYTDYDDTAPSNCSGSYYPTSATCVGTGDVPSGCDMSTTNCSDSKPGPDNLTDVFIGYDNTEFLDAHLKWNNRDRCRNKKYTVNDQVKAFLLDVVCSYDTFSDPAVSRYYLYSVGKKLHLKTFGDTDQYSAIENMEPDCQTDNLFEVFYQYSLVTKRTGVNTIVLVILSFRQAAEMQTVTNDFVNSASIINTWLDGATLVVVTTYVPTGSVLLYVHQFACIDNTLTTPNCPNYLGSINDHGAVIIARLSDLLGF